MNWIKLNNIDEKFIVRGSIFRIPAQWPYEELLDMILYDPLQEHGGMGFLVISGYKAGLIKQHLPQESVIEGKRGCVSTSWLKQNWSYWVYPECPVEDVWVCEGCPAPQEMPSFN